MNDFCISLLHSGVPPTGWLHSDWSPEPMVVFSSFALAALFVLWTGPLSRRRPGSETRQTTGKQTTYFLLGCLAYLLALSPPLDDWSDFYLLTAHMFQHMIIMFVVAPLFLAGTPAWVLQPLANNRFTNKIGWALTRPIVAAIVSTFIVIVWHFPGSYDAALKHQPIHIAQHGSFLIRGAARVVAGPWATPSLAEDSVAARPVSLSLSVFPSSRIGWRLHHHVWPRFLSVLLHGSAHLRDRSRCRPATGRAHDVGRWQHDLSHLDYRHFPDMGE